MTKIVLKVVLSICCILAVVNTANAGCAIVHHIINTESTEYLQKDEISIGLGEGKEAAFLKGCPRDVSRQVENENECHHFAGEISGTPETDKNAHKQMDELKCDMPVSPATYKLVKKYKNDNTTCNIIIDALKIIYSGEDEFEIKSIEEMRKECQKY